MQVFFSEYGDISFDINALTIRLTTTTDSNAALSFEATSDLSPIDSQHGLSIMFLRGDHFLGSANFPTSPNSSSRATRHSEMSIQCSLGIPSDCMPAVEFFCIFTTQISMVEQCEGATIMLERAVEDIAASGTYLGMEKVLYGEEVADIVREEGCGICIKEFIDGTEVGWLQCSHACHYKCLCQWLEQKRSCPYCRASVRES